MARTDNLTNFLTDVADAIRQKKGDSSKILAKDFDTEISNLSGGGETSVYAPSCIAFVNCLKTDMTDEIYGWDDKNLTKLDYFFYGCANIQSLNLTHIDTSNVTSMMDCFRGCTKLKNLNIQNWNTDNVVAVNRMFRDCKAIESIDLSSSTFKNITNTQYMFENCQNLNFLNISLWDLTKIMSFSSMFSDVPTSCLIIVKDDASKAWMNSKFASYTNVKTLAEYQG